MHRDCTQPPPWCDHNLHRPHLSTSPWREAPGHARAVAELIVQRTGLRPYFIQRGGLQCCRTQCHKGEGWPQGRYYGYVGTPVETGKECCALLLYGMLPWHKFNEALQNARTPWQEVSRQTVRRCYGAGQGNAMLEASTLNTSMFDVLRSRPGSSFSYQTQSLFFQLSFGESSKGE